MQGDLDHYEAYYAEKLWNLLPAVYRAGDSEVFNSNGPLQELIDRIGTQAAILRRSLDRQWEDQSIETCDDWVIAYIGDLLATNLVSSLDARGQRLDVYKTIYYRRRKGTVAILEEIATDITGWSARVVEFFHRLSRNRHNLDPVIGRPADAPDAAAYLRLQQAEGLVGQLTQTPIGGWADLRQVYGASKTHSAFDEFFYTADMRRGQGQVGWHNIPRLGVFLWRLYSFPVGEPVDTPLTRTAQNRGIGVTPVEYTASPDCPGHYTFDPSGREIPLFAAVSRPPGDTWMSPSEWQLPVPISRPLLQAEQSQLYASDQPDGSRAYHSLGIFDQGGNLVTGDHITADPRDWATRKASLSFLIEPTSGKLIKGDTAPQGLPLVTYHYGFASAIGAGSYDRRSLKLPSPQLPSPMPAGSSQFVIGGGNSLSTSLGTLASRGTLTIQDSLTYTSVSNLSSIDQVILHAENKTRPLIRLPASTPTFEWSFIGNAGSTLVLEGLWIAGGDLVLKGKFDRVYLRCCTLDPGTAANGTYAKTVDGRDLAPCHLLIEAEIEQLIIDACILGPIQIPDKTQTNEKRFISTLTINDSIIQALGTEKALNFHDGVVNLNRCTVMGQAVVHQLEASECILDDVFLVENYQQGCVRFSAWSRGSKLPRPYESVEIEPRSPLFTTRLFGQPGYAQLQAGVDAQIQAGRSGATISAGAENGSEMGAFSREKAAIKDLSLRIKYKEYMPLGLVPVLIYVT